MICPQCKTWVAGTVNFCPNCGTLKVNFLPDGYAAPLPPAPPMPIHPASIAPAMLQALGLRLGERTVRVLRGGYVLPESSFDEDAPSAPMASGILIVSDQRLIFVREKGLLNKSYHQMESIELRHITDHRLTSLLRLKELEVEAQDQRGRIKRRFSNLYEIDPLTLKPLQPSTPEEARVFFGTLFGAAK